MVRSGNSVSPKNEAYEDMSELLDVIPLSFEKRSVIRNWIISAVRGRNTADNGKLAAGCILGKRLVVLDEFQYVEWHIVVASPRHIRKRVVDDDRHDVNVFFEDR